MFQPENLKTFKPTAYDKQSNEEWKLFHALNT